MLYHTHVCPGVSLGCHVRCWLVFGAHPSGGVTASTVEPPVCGGSSRGCTQTPLLVEGPFQGPECPTEKFCEKVALSDMPSKPPPNPGPFKASVNGFLGANYFPERDFEKVSGELRTALPAGPSWGWYGVAGEC